MQLTLTARLNLFRESMSLAWDSVRANRTRSALTVIGVVVGVAVVVIVAALLQGAQTFVVNSTAGFAPNVLRIEKASFQDFGADGQAFVEAQAKRPDIFVDDLEYLTERLGDEIEFGAQGNAVLPARRGAKTLVGVSIQGVTPNITDLSNIKIAYGRGLTSTDETYRRNVCIIGQDIVDELFPTSGAIGEEIQLGQLRYQVVGVAESRGSSFGASQDGFVQMPLGTFTRVFGSRSRSLAILAKAKDPEKLSLADVEERVRVALRIRRKLVGTDKEDDFSFVTAKSVQAFSASLTGIVGTIVYPLTAISLFVGGIVVMNMMLSSVTERTREIGVRIAVGARRRDILIQFLIETTTLTVIGGVIGVIFAAGIIWMLAWATKLPLTLPIWAVAAAIGVSCAVGIVFGVVPARQAAALDPIEALRSE
ncbi:MAG: ABC transporter permease [Pyrinomonadaceae bacterium]|nr:ABC transporter permease [Pyrinomonadaceae bacterium]MBP6212453.1 ABC transporter permease [Pyrinomonadaceae bacterium]